MLICCRTWLGMILKHLILAQDTKACDTLIRNSQADLILFDQAIRVTSFILSLNIQLHVNFLQHFYCSQIKHLV